MATPYPGNIVWRRRREPCRGGGGDLPVILCSGMERGGVPERAAVTVKGARMACPSTRGCSRCTSVSRPDTRCGGTRLGSARTGRHFGAFWAEEPLLPSPVSRQPAFGKACRRSRIRALALEVQPRAPPRSGRGPCRMATPAGRPNCLAHFRDDALPLLRPLAHPICEVYKRELCNSKRTEGWEERRRARLGPFLGGIRVIGE